MVNGPAIGTSKTIFYFNKLNKYKWFKLDTIKNGDAAKNCWTGYAILFENSLIIYLVWRDTS